MIEFQMISRPALIVGMLTTVLLNPLSALAQPSALCTETPYSILVRVHDVRSAEGNVTIVLYDDNPKHFLKKGEKLVKHRIPAEAGITTACLAVPHAGVYAIAVYHDEDGNRKLNRSWIGLPREGYGFSNNPTLSLAPPSHHEAAFSVQAGHTIVNIDIRY